MREGGSKSCGGGSLCACRRALVLSPAAGWLGSVFPAATTARAEPAEVEAGLPGREIRHRLAPRPDVQPERRVALTLDACSGDADLELLQWLAQEGLSATVFATGRWLRGQPQALERLRAHPALFSVQNHGERHVPAVVAPGRSIHGVAAAADADAVRREVREGARAVQAATGVAPRWFRGATARYDAQSLRLLAELGQQVAGFSISADAGATLGAEEVARRVARAQPADVLLAHLNRPQGGTREGLRRSLPALRARGLEFVKLDGVTMQDFRGP